MRIKFHLRRVGDFVDCSIQSYATSINLGFNDKWEALQLLEEFQSAVDDLQWFINSQKVKNEDTI